MLKKIVVSLLLVLGGMASCGVMVDRREQPPNPVKVMAEYQPGQARPGQGYCSWNYYEYPESYCWFEVERETVYYVFDHRAGLITRTTYTLFHQEIQIGELVVLWGDPDWQYMSYGTVEVGWRDRSAWLITQRFNPKDKVWMISYFSEPQTKQERWAGFRSQP